MSRPLAAVLFLPLLAAASLPHAQGRCGATYEVIQGDTLYSIARLCRSSVTAISAASGLADPRRIETGQLLVIPGWSSPAADPARAAQPTPPTRREDRPDDAVEDPTRGPEGM
jgi:murein DD-endopeptidase MepM/ murein hydrolase activator NlpD